MLLLCNSVSFLLFGDIVRYICYMNKYSKLNITCYNDYLYNIISPKKTEKKNKYIFIGLVVLVFLFIIYGSLHLFLGNKITI